MTRLTILPRNKEIIEVFYFDATPLDIILMPFSLRNISAAENISLKRLDNLPLMCYNKYIR